ncbi:MULTISPECIES: hypothetical protein [Helicobacter]|uniref:Uncharacterized protein n=1 Tax=Helicobacter typhlonius TaxID=76936 RepID=A0A099UEP7_9HELI|nr:MULTISPECIES: hypothetical protein [Helicobacter]TLD79549.1 hypothetical protein LS75_001005 [Helicobacter typhlonius]TLD88342.1 hypothetical protein LS67_005145 [Helicobacter sp. MIT 03-1616]CUU39326.1 Hypothetical protein BN2458_PEG0440 [Helicobacter typhlonius]HCD72687.1 hypothetical protein [Helicobacter sp.]
MVLSPDSVFMLVSIFCVAIFVLVTMLWLFGPAPKKLESENEEKGIVTIEEIMKVLDNPRSTLTKLTEAADNFFENYDKLELSDYRKRSFLFAITVHHNTSTELIVKTEEKLRELNPTLARDLNKTLNRALDARSL